MVQIGLQYLAVVTARSIAICMCSLIIFAPSRIDRYLRAQRLELFHKQTGTGALQEEGLAGYQHRVVALHATAPPPPPPLGCLLPCDIYADACDQIARREYE